MSPSCCCCCCCYFASHCLGRECFFAMHFRYEFCRQSRVRVKFRGVVFTTRSARSALIHREWIDFFLGWNWKWRQHRDNRSPLSSAFSNYSSLDYMHAVMRRATVVIVFAIGWSCFPFFIFWSLFIPSLSSSSSAASGHHVSCVAFSISLCIPIWCGSENPTNVSTNIHINHKNDFFFLIHKCNNASVNRSEFKDNELANKRRGTMISSDPYGFLVSVLMSTSHTEPPK